MRKGKIVFAISILAAVFLVGCGLSLTQKTVTFTLRTDQMDKYKVYIGVDGDIDGVVNPVLKVDQGDVVEIALADGNGTEQDISFPDFETTSEKISTQGSSTWLTFIANKVGTFPYYSTISGNREAGMQGWIQVGSGPEVVDKPPAIPADVLAKITPSAGINSSAQTTPGASGGVTNTDTLSGSNNTGRITTTSTGTLTSTTAMIPTAAADIVRLPTDVGEPVGSRGPTHVRVDLEAVEVTGLLADGATFQYWTFNGKVPGPFLRVRVDDEVEVHLKNNMSSMMIHSVDLHAVTGPGGGMIATAPGQETSFTFKALKPGLYVYHCATPVVAEHISNGMYGLILVEPEGGLPPVDREFYVMQGELYTNQKFGSQGLLTFDMDKLLNETPEYFVFNGAVASLTTRHPLEAEVGDTVRIFFGVGGPNFISSFHVIGEIFDRVYDQASLTAAPQTDVQTTLVPPGGATMVELQMDVPGTYLLVDHALSRALRGLAGYLKVTGEPNPEIFNPGAMSSTP